MDKWNLIKLNSFCTGKKKKQEKKERKRNEKKKTLARQKDSP